MMMMNVFTSAALLLLLLSGGAVVCASKAARSTSAIANAVSLQGKGEEERSTWVWSHRDDGVLTEARVEGSVVFTDDYTDVLSVSDDGLFQATDERDGVARKLRVVRGSDGTVQRTYYLGGRKHEFDAEAKAWLSKFLLLAVREGGLNAKARVQRLLRQRGARGVLDEISLIKTDYARRIYFSTLIEEGDLDSATLNDALRQAARQLSSDYERATFLIETGERFLSSDELIEVFFEAAGKVSSDYERHRVLSSVLRKQPREQVLGPMLEAASSISSDYEKASFLIEAAPLYINSTALRSAFMRAVNTISSDYERGRVLSFVAKRMQTGSALD